MYGKITRILPEKGLRRIVQELGNLGELYRNFSFLAEFYGKTFARVEVYQKRRRIVPEV